MKTKRCLLIFILLLPPLYFKGQEIQYLQGKVYNAATGEPLPYAAVILLSENIGTISNFDGAFLLKYTKEYIFDTLFVTHLGFRPIKLPVHNIDTNFIVLKLMPSPVQIREVLISPLTPQEILEKSLASVSSNYTMAPKRLRGIFTEVIFENNKPVQFIEALLDIYYSSYNQENKNNDQMAILASKQAVDIHLSKMWDFIRFINGPFEVLQADAMKNQKDFFIVVKNRVNFLKEKHFKYFNYSLFERPGKDSLPDQYIIIFSPAKLHNKAAYTGNIIIRKDNFAVEQIEFYVTGKHMYKIDILDQETSAQFSELGIEITPMGFYCSINYKQHNGRYLLNNCEINYHFDLAKSNGSLQSKVSVTDNFWLTDSLSGPVNEIPRKIRLKKGISLQEHVERSKNHSFRKSYLKPIVP